MDQATITRDPKTHDYTRREWGHAVEILRVNSEGFELEVMGFGLGVKSGDFLLLPTKDGETRYEIEKIEYMRDPIDQWFATLTFAPRDEAAS